MNIAEAELEDLGTILVGSAGGALNLGVRHRPEELAILAATTSFTRKEIQLIYRGFKQECPTGLVDEESFKKIFIQFFPQGGKSSFMLTHSISKISTIIISMKNFINRMCDEFFPLAGHKVDFLGRCW